MAGSWSGRAVVRVDAEAYQALLYRVELLEGLIKGAMQAAQGRAIPHAQVKAELLAAYG